MRNKLKDVIPLDTPYIIQIFPIYDCNKRCSYCMHSTPIEKRPFISDVKEMTMQTFKKVVYHLLGFPNKLKVLRFVGIGEPLLHPHILDMIDYAKKYDIAENIELLTNGTLLYPEFCDQLSNSGLDTIVISTEQKDEKLIEALEYMNYQCETKVVIKSFTHKNDSIYEKICEELRHEVIVPLHNGVGDKTQTQWGTALTDFKTCPQPYYHMQINPDGNVVPCYAWEYPIILGNVNNDILVDIWNSDKLKEFRASGCMCDMAKYRYREEDNID